MEETVSLRSPGAMLDGRLEIISLDDAVLIAHPHTLYGGNMNNSVVTGLADAFRGRGFTCLRFDFRGAGNSRGSYDHGVGEQEDIAAGIDFLIDRGYSRILLTGYSFGAWVIARFRQRPADRKPDAVGGIILVAPPVALLDFNEIGPIRGLRRVIAGARDEIAPPDQVAALLPRWEASAELKTIAGADHFFLGHMDELKALAGEAAGRARP